MTVENENGLHLVPCSRIAKTAMEFGGSVILTNGDRTADAKTIIELMALNATQGTVLQIEARGDGCEAIVAAIQELFESQFAVDADDSGE